MSLQQIIFIGVALSIFLQVLTVGMQLTASDLAYVLRRRALLLRSLLAMNLCLPLAVIVVCKVFSLHPALIVALVALSVGPVSAMFAPGMSKLVAHDRQRYARGLFFSSTVLAVLLTPLSVELIQRAFSERDVLHVSPLAVGNVVFSSVLLPLGVGLALGRWRPGTRAWIPAVQKVSGLVLLVCVVPIVVAAWPVMGSVIREGTLLAIILIAVAGLAIGHLLGGPEDSTRTALASATVSRHPGVAIAVASLTEETLAPIGVLLAVLVSELAVMPYKTWRKRTVSSASTVSQSPWAGLRASRHRSSSSSCDPS